MKNKILISKTTIFIFDSGLGGITIFNYIKNIFLNINFIYLLDNKYFPYGNKSKSFILKRLIKILNKISLNHNISLVIIACNTASVSSLPQLKKYFNFPIIGVTPVFDLAIKKTKNKVIGFLATNTTIQNYKVQNKINLLRKKYTIEIISSFKLVLLAEYKLLGYKIILNEIKKIFFSWYKLKIFPDTVILGCTHFPLIKKEIQNVFPKKIKFLDAKYFVIHKFKKIVKYNKNLLSKKKNIVYYTKIDKNINKIRNIFLKMNFHIFKKFNT
ncbi:glutamate racemase [Enterobacteriaceae endosymbiont of Donacia provostii]|uniref:glutamate racemase n=1 Tax=Enterobacteriaceae endosymbiont of Donacia provostii TaxID=2675781 RepID=UPI001448D421|nr:glutamate racemase [Enterobacteriaceae endosymbiont of Donacia provostii]QJC33813.1 glutamate racemase [Enterobacteriaceae endosymbiont of Donacia provostii]